MPKGLNLALDSDTRARHGFSESYHLGENNVKATRSQCHQFMSLQMDQKKQNKKGQKRVYPTQTQP